MWYNSAPPTRSRSFKALFEKGKNQPFLTQPMRNASLFREEGCGEPYLSEVADCLHALYSLNDPDRLIQISLDLILSLTEAQTGSLFLWDDSAKELVLKVSRGKYLNKRLEPRIKLREGVSGLVAHNGHSVLVKNIGQDERFRGVKRFRSYHTSSFISISLLSGNKLVGIVNITEKENLSPFDEVDFRRAESIAKHVALSYENLKIKKRLSEENEKIHHEITRLKESLRQQESMASIGKLACSLAHELNNPLDAIRRFVNLALDHVMEDSLGREYLLRAKEGIRRAIQVIRGLLSFSRETRRHTKHKTELHVLLEKSLTLIAQAPSFQKIRFEKDFCDKPVYVEDNGLTAVFQNLFDNANHAMKGEGVIIVSTHPNGEYVVVAVKDTGCGVQEEHRTHLFEPFFTTKDTGEGTGMGLAICREIVERSGGAIAFESEKEKGTTFFVKLPYENNGEDNGKNHTHC